MCVVVPLCAFLLVAGCTRPDDVRVSEKRQGTHKMTLSADAFESEGNFVVRLVSSRPFWETDDPLLTYDFNVRLMLSDGVTLNCSSNAPPGMLVEGGSIGWTANIEFRCGRQGRYKIDDIVDVQVRFRRDRYVFHRSSAQLSNGILKWPSTDGSNPSVGQRVEGQPVPGE
jgi:hypothetical protein